MKDLIASSLASALKPLESKLQQLSSTDGAKAGSSLTSDLQEIRAKQQQILIDTRANTLTSAGAQSQYRSLANIRLKVSNAVEALDDYLLTFSSSEDDAYRAITPIKASLEEALGDADDRIDLIFKADTEPKYGWKAITALEEKKKLSSKDPEKDKAFAACLKKVQDADKKTSKSFSQSQNKSFRNPPGGNPGYSSSGGDSVFQVVLAAKLTSSVKSS